MSLGTMSRTFPEIFSLLLICLRYKPNAPRLPVCVMLKDRTKTNVRWRSGKSVSMVSQQLF